MNNEMKLRAKNAMQMLLADKIAELPVDTKNEEVQELIVKTVYEQARQDGRLSDTEIDALVEEMVNEFLYLGPLQPLMSDPLISEIMVNGGGFNEDGSMKPHITWIERDGVLERRDDIVWDGEAHVQRIMNRILSRQGRRIDEGNPIEDGSLFDGSRFNGTIYPIAKDGSTFNVRRFRKDSINARQYIEFGTASLEELTFLSTLTAAKGTILISGGTGSGKTTLLNILASFIPETERIITIEDTCELLVHTTHPHVVRLEARKNNAEGAGAVSLDELLISTLRKRPDRIIIGECRGSEAYTMLEALNTGHEGSLTTIHANDPVSALRRLVTLVKQGDSTLSEEIIKQKIADAIDCIVQIQRLSTGERVITQIEYIGGYADNNIQHDTLFEYRRVAGNSFENGSNNNSSDSLNGNLNASKTNSAHVSLGVQPHALKEKIENAGYEYEPEWFLGYSNAS